VRGRIDHVKNSPRESGTSIIEPFWSTCRPPGLRSGRLRIRRALGQLCSGSRIWAGRCFRPLPSGEVFACVIISSNE
jgi:hypothetical protein